MRGGSRKTWSSSEDISHFWPKEWLPSEPGFEHVRIYSYGYNSDWAERKANVWSIHDFGQGLVASLENCPEIRRGEEVRLVLTTGHTRHVSVAEQEVFQAPLIMVGHSMGGLVIKKVTPGPLTPGNLLSRS